MGLGGAGRGAPPGGTRRGGGADRAASGLRLLESVGDLIGASEDLEETLKSIVQVIAERMRTEACSLYLLEPVDGLLSLWATYGLDEDAVGRVQMRTDEGLTGLVVETVDAVAVADAPSHPRFKFFPETREERFHSFLGVPILERRTVLGVLVVQTLRRRSFVADEIRLLRTIAGQLAGLLVQARLLDALQAREREQEDFRRRAVEALRRVPNERAGAAGDRLNQERDPGERLRGITASPGFGIGAAHILHPQVVLTEIEDAPAQAVDVELARLTHAVEVASRDIERQKERLEAVLPDATGKIFDAYAMMVRDETFLDRVREAIGEGSTAEYAVRRAVEELVHTLERVEDSYFRERAIDVRDVGQRLLRILLEIETDQERVPGAGSVLVAREVTLTDLAEIDPTQLTGIALATGAATSHATILAKSLEIPTVVGVERLLEAVGEGDRIIVDGNAGVVYRQPGPEVVREYERLERDYRAFNERLAELHDLPAVTTDGHRVALHANVGLVSDVVLGRRHGAEGVGLYRTEFPFLSFREAPSETEQVEIYRKVIEGMEGRPITIRTLDLGADKYPAYLHVPPEQNPFLGWRSIRVSLELPELFDAQVRAILRAGLSGPTRILLPMISSLDELRRARELIEDAQDDLKREGIPFSLDVPLGVMIEVPAAVEIAPHLAREADFLSIGTNDLIQYVLAVDRNNQKVAPLYQSLHPAVVGSIARCVTAAREAGKPISMCGEMASDPLATLLLLGLGLDEFSMEPFFIPVIKKLIRSVSKADAVAVAEEALRLPTARQIKGTVFDAMRRLGVIELLDMYQ